MRVCAVFPGGAAPASFAFPAATVVAGGVALGIALAVVEVAVSGALGALDASGTGVVLDVAPPLGVLPAPVPPPAFSPFVHAASETATRSAMDRFIPVLRGWRTSSHGRNGRRPRA